MRCEICGKKPTQSAKCPACGFHAAYFCEGMVCQPPLWKIGPKEKPSAVPLMNFQCARCTSALALEPLPESFETVFSPGKLFGFIGTYLLHGYGDEVPHDGAGHEFAIAHFLNTMAPETAGWSFLANTTEPNPKTHANRPLRAMAFAHSQPMGTKLAIGAALKWVQAWLTSPLPHKVSVVPESFYTTAMVLNGKLAVVETVPVGDAIPLPLQGQGNYSSRSTKAEIDGVVTYMRDPHIQKKIGWPVFSVWDCNCFHNSGYVMGKYALDTAIALSGEDKPPVLIVNIDQHSDAGSRNQTIISSDRWGIALAECYPNSAYLSFSSGGGNSVTHQIETHYRPGSAAVTSPKSMAIPLDCKFTNAHLDQLFSGDAGQTRAAREALKAYWSFLLTKIYAGAEDRPANFKFVYLTVDRDCMKGNLNQWGDAKAILENYGQVAGLADAILSTLVSTGSRVVGFDVTGLPEDRERLKCNISKGDKIAPAAVLSEVKAELTSFQEIFQRHIVTR